MSENETQSSQAPEKSGTDSQHEAPGTSQSRESGRQPPKQIEAATISAHEKRKKGRAALHAFFEAQNHRAERQARIKAGTASGADIAAEQKGIAADATHQSKRLASTINP